MMQYTFLCMVGFILLKYLDFSRLCSWGILIFNSFPGKCLSGFFLSVALVSYDVFGCVSSSSVFREAFVKNWCALNI